MDKVMVTGILVKNDEGKVLLVKKPDGVGPYAGTYLTPGGGVKPGERIDDAVQRELFEETGVKAVNIKRVLFDDDITENWKGDKKHFIMLLYTGDYLSGDLKPTAGDDDHLAVIQWFAPKEIAGIRLSPPLQKLFAMIGTWKGKFIFPAGLYIQ